MPHILEDRDGMQVLVVSDMGKRFDLETGLEIKRRSIENLAIVHSTEIARYYGIEHADVGMGDRKVPGVWNLVHDNIIGQRVAYNSETQAESDRYIRDWLILKDGQGRAYDTKEIIKAVKQVLDTDDGNYVRYDDLVKFAKAQGWTKGGGLPPTNPAPVIDIAAIVSAVMIAMQANQKPTSKFSVPEELDIPAEPKTRSPSQRAHDAWLKAGRPEDKDQWKLDWLEVNG